MSNSHPRLTNEDISDCESDEERTTCITIASHKKAGYSDSVRDINKGVNANPSLQLAETPQHLGSITSLLYKQTPRATEASAPENVPRGSNDARKSSGVVLTQPKRRNTLQRKASDPAPVIGHPATSIGPQATSNTHPITRGPLRRHSNRQRRYTGTSNPINRRITVPETSPGTEYSPERKEVPEPIPEMADANENAASKATKGNAKQNSDNNQSRTLRDHNENAKGKPAAKGKKGKTDHKPSPEPTPDTALMSHPPAATLARDAEVILSSSDPADPPVVLTVDSEKVKRIIFATFSEKKMDFLQFKQDLFGVKIPKQFDALLRVEEGRGLTVQYQQSWIPLYPFIIMQRNKGRNFAFDVVSLLRTLKFEIPIAAYDLPTVEAILYHELPDVYKPPSVEINSATPQPGSNIEVTEH